MNECDWTTRRMNECDWTKPRSASKVERANLTSGRPSMAVKHKKYPKIQGVQFHPESIITENGLTIIKNWVDLINA